MPPAVRYHRLPSEQLHPSTSNLDRLTPLQLVRLMSREDRRVVESVRRQHRTIARAIHLMTQRLRAGGRLWVVGAGTSGRLGVLEAAECPPTFSTPPSMIRAIIAGGRRAVFRSQEGAEDDRVAARAAVRHVRRADVAIGIAASGVTPFVAEGLQHAAARGAATILITCHPDTAIRTDVRIPLAVGPEILAGSTRLKAATATKLVLNMLTLGVMVQLGKTYGNLMVDVRPTSRKLRARAVRIIQTIAGCSESTAVRCLRQAKGQTKTAVLMAAAQLSYSAARQRVARARGSLRKALG